MTIDVESEIRQKKDFVTTYDPSDAIATLVSVSSIFHVLDVAKSVGVSTIMTKKMIGTSKEITVHFGS